MLTRREMMVAMVAAAATSKVAIAETKPTQAMGSTVFDWKTMQDKPSAVGSVRSIFSTPTATLENLEMHVTTLNPGKMPHPPHTHPNEELIIIREGTLESLSNGEWKRVGPGSVIFNGSNQLHALKNVGTTPAVYHVVNFKTEKTPAPLPS